MTKKKIVILGTGGTIAGTAASAIDHVGYTAAQVSIEALVAAMADDSVSRSCELLTEQVAQIDSKDMGFAVWARLARRVDYWLMQPEVLGVVITHGTDTLEETAWFLQTLLNPAKPVVLTCAMRPASALAADGPQNMRDAVAVAMQPGARGVVMVCAGEIHSARDVQKVHTYRLDAFSSGDAGPVGHVEKGRLRLVRDWPLAAVDVVSSAIKGMVSRSDGSDWPRVEIVMSYAGASAVMVDALVSGGVRGLVVAATGSGTLHHELEAALLSAQAFGIEVVRSTRCVNGGVLSKPGDTIPDAEGLSPVKARISMMLRLMDRCTAVA
jgi:L-asparaginase